MASAKELREVVSAARPLIEEWLGIAEQIAALRDMATDRGLDWSQIKALVKAQVQDERAGDTKRVQRIIEKAEFASAYADMLGLSEKVNENNFSGECRPAPAPLPPHDPETGEVEQPAATPPLPASALCVSTPAAEPIPDPRHFTATLDHFTPPAFLSGPRPALRPHCLNPDNCSGYGRNHCHTCGKAAEKEGVAA